RVGDRDHHADHGALAVDQRTARAAGVDRRIELDEPGQPSGVGLGGALQAGDDAGGGAVGQAQLVADGDDFGPDRDAAAQGRRHHDLGQVGRGQQGDVHGLVGGGDSCGGLGAVGEDDADRAAVVDDVVGGHDGAGVGDDEAGA